MRTMADGRRQKKIKGVPESLMLKYNQSGNYMRDTEDRDRKGQENFARTKLTIRISVFSCN